MTQGTPSTTPVLARLMLQIPTTTTETIAIRAIFISVRLTGGATRPLRRRRESPDQRRKPTRPTTTTIPIQLTIGSIAPHINLYSTWRLLLRPARFG